MAAAAKMGRGVKTIALLLVSAVCLPAGTYYVTVAGLGGEPEFEQRFTGWAQSIERTLHSSSADAKIETLHGPAATRKRLQAMLERIASECRPEDDLVVILIGHGTFDGLDYKINLLGPDVTAIELAGLLERVTVGRQLVVNMTSASGGSLDALRRENRVVITATKSGTEKNATIFARYWADALRDPSADTDKNQAITALEAFRYASRKTAEFYKSQKRIATEHALLEDTGHAEAVRSPSPENGQGRLAATFTLLRFGAAQAATADPAKRNLLAKREELERQIDRLKYQKAAMPTDEYRKRLTVLLIELARTQENLDK
jgi:hypothetical protein